MKRAILAVCVAVVALPLLAQQEDSPLVRAAKASGRMTKHSVRPVITNDTLARSGGHLATTDVTEPIKLNPDYSTPGAPASAAAPTVTTTTRQTIPNNGTPTVQPSTASTYQPSTASSYAPGTANTSQVQTMSTSALPTAATSQPPTAPVAAAAPPKP